MYSSDFQMRFLSLICRVFLFGSFVLTEEYNRLHYGATMIDELLHFFESMLQKDIRLDFSPDIKSITENRDGLSENQVKKRIHLYERCVKKARDGLFYLVKKKNASIGNVFYVFFSGDNNKVQYESEMENRTLEAFQIAVDTKLFFFHLLPKYYNELGKNLSIEFTEEEIKRSEKMIKDAQEQSKQDLLHMMKELGVEI